MTKIKFINKTRKAAILPMLAVSMVALIGIIALAVDIGILAQTKSQLQSAADAAALSGSRSLTGDASTDNNRVAVPGLALSTIQASKIMGKTLQSSQLTTQVGYYNYNAVLGEFQPIFTGSKPATENWSAVKTSVTFIQPTSLAKFFNYSAFSATASATAVHRPRDLAIILDYSGSMRFNSIPAYPLSGSISGSMNPDQIIPKFGPWSAITSVMQRTSQYGDSAPNNHTSETDDGPPIVKDFYCKQADGSYINAFYRPLTPYNWRTTSTNFALPAPDNFREQHNSPVQFSGSDTGMGGDRWPQTNGYNLAFPNNTGPPYASTVRQYVSGNTTTQANTHAKNVEFELAGYTDFQGFTMGPGYYGKTFYMWPPDPRAANDWRKKFFFYGSNSTTPCDDNSLLFNTTNGRFRTASTTSYKINYTAVMNWINSGPKVFPDNMRAGRVLYYSTIPTTIPDAGGTLDQKFWRSYIDYVIGAGNQTQILYGQNTTAYGPTRITAKTSLTANPKPYMHYNDNPIHPRLNFWFGPVSFLSFLSDYRIGRNWLPGTSHESATWQLKAGIQSALVDIKKNHPNDQAALIYFSTLSEYNVARVPMGKDFTRMNNALFYPYSLLDSLSDPNAEIRPYGNSFNTSYLGTISSTGGIAAGQWDSKTSAEIPNADGGTNPEMAFMAAYNQFSSATGFNGRKGANKMIIFETDGVPTSNAYGTFQSGGAYYSKFIGISDAGSSGADDIYALNTLQYVCNLTTASQCGYSTIKNPVSVHSIAFGQLFETNSTSTGKPAAMNFLVKCQIKGNTSPAGATTLNSEKIITGTYNQRIEKVRSAFERVLQSGIQITLIE
jgi:Flp pilus assembly protein TadG